jgi:hypothetical protein
MKPSFLVRDPVNVSLSGGSGETPEPTVKVWMGEGKKSGLVKGEVCPYISPIFLLPFPRTLKSSFFRVLFVSF